MKNKTTPPPPPSKAKMKPARLLDSSVLAKPTRAEIRASRAKYRKTFLTPRKKRRAHPKPRALKPLLAAALRACPRKPTKAETDLIAAYCGVAIKGATTFARKTLDYGTDNIAGGGGVGVVVRTRDKVARLLNLAGRAAVHESKVDSAEDIHVYGGICALVLLGLWPEMTTNERLAL